MKTAALLVMVVACSSHNARTDPPMSGPTEDCKADEDCAAVETQCCDHCNGGKVEAFPKATAASHKPTGCEATLCTQMACTPAAAKCSAGKCTVVEAAPAQLTPTDQMKAFADLACRCTEQTCLVQVAQRTSALARELAGKAMAKDDAEAFAAATKTYFDCVSQKTREFAAP